MKSFLITRKETGYILKIVFDEKALKSHFYSDLKLLCAAIWSYLTVKNFITRPVLFKSLESLINNPIQFANYLQMRFNKGLPAAGFELEIPASEFRFVLKENIDVKKKIIQS